MPAEVPALRKSAAIFHALAAVSRPVGAGALSTTLGIPRSTVYELLHVLDEVGFTAQVPGGHVLGPGVHELGSSYLRSNPLQRLAAPIVQRLVEVTGATTQRAVLRGWQTVYILKEQSLDSLAIVTAAGVHMPAYLTATGRAMLAELPVQEVIAALEHEVPFVNRTGVGPRGLRELNAELALTRERGWAYEQGEITPGVITLAVPVVDATGRPIAGLGVSMDATAADHSPFADLANVMVQHAREITHRLS